MLEHSVVVGLVSFVITFFLTENFDGPFNLLRKIRDWATSISPLFVCHWCLGTYISIICTVVYIIVLGLPVVYVPFVWLASLAIAGIVHEVIMRL